jgi:hypothetical protein
MFVDELKNQARVNPSGEKQGPWPEEPQDKKPTAPNKPPQVLQLHSKTDLTKVIKGWPNKDCPRFTSGIRENMAEWLLTMGVLLWDCQCHKELLHVTAGQRLIGKAFRDHKDTLLNGTCPTNCVLFQAWLIKLSPMRLTPQQIALELDHLCQEANKTCQEFYK